MKTTSRSVLYKVRETDVTIPIDLLKEKIHSTFFNLSKFSRIKLSFRYTTNDGNIIQLLSIYNIDNFYRKNNNDLLDYIVKRLDYGLIHELNEIESFSLSYSYVKPKFSS